MNKTLQQKQQQLRIKNQLLNQKKKQIEDELKNIKVGKQDEQQFYEQNNQQLIAQTQVKNPKKDIIAEIQAVNKIQQERNINKLKQLKQRHAQNIKIIADQKQKLSALENNLEQANKTYEIKFQMVKQLEGKGKKISEQSKKWISQITKLNEKQQQLREKYNNMNKQYESVKQQLNTSQKNLKNSQNQKKQLEVQQTNLNSKINNLTQQLLLMKDQVKQNNQNNAQQLEAIKKHNDRVRINQKRLQRQKTQLIKAFRKLNNYILLIRKQNMHIQTAKNLGFSLDQFLQAVDKGDRM